MRTTLTLANFAKKLGYASASDSEFRDRLKLWQSNGVVKVQQSGFAGHSLSHPKIVILQEDLTVFEKFQRVETSEGPQTDYACPYCGRIVNIHTGLRRAWFLGRQLQVLLECSRCVSRFNIRVTDRQLIKQLRGKRK